MTADMMDIADFAARLEAAARSAKPVPPLGIADVATGYDVQRVLVERRGEPLAGLKMGLTSKAKQEQMGVGEPIWGRLTASMRVPDGGTVELGELIHPRVEPEVAFRLGPGGEPTAAAAALEVIDSRFIDFQYTLPDVVADNTSAARFVIGPWQPVPATLDNLEIRLEVDGQLAQSGSTAAILGDPRRSLARGLALAAEAGVVPEPGWVFLAGAATAAVPLAAGSTVRVVVTGLGAASLVAA
jgi:2-oxo-3-hexenedioate decarboxylase